MKVGILVPGSKAHPELMADFIRGLDLFLQQNHVGNEIQVVSEYIGYGGKEKEVYERVEKLIMADKIDVLIGYVDFRILPVLQPLLYTSGKLMLVVNPGANIPENWIPQPNIIYLTMQQSFLCWLNGLLAAREMPAKAILASTFYDCGYFHAASVVKSFMRNKGDVCFNYINQQSYDTAFAITELTLFLATNSDVSKLLCVFDSLPASLFYQKLSLFPGANKLRLYASPMMLNEEALGSDCPGFNFSIEGYLPWFPANENPANKYFIEYFKEQGLEKPSLFSLQGWESAMILCQIVEKGHSNCNGSMLVNDLKDITIESPRGALKLDLQTHFYLAPVFKFSFDSNAPLPLYEELEFPQQEWQHYTKEKCEGISSGWTNTYLCY